MKIKEVIVVEGKHDSQKIKSCVECDTIETYGCHIGKARLALIEQIQKHRGVIIFTDPDGPGDKVRSIINHAIPGCKNAFIEKKKAKTSRKVGVEHANKEDIIEALSHLMTYEEQMEITLSWMDFVKMGFTGKPDSQRQREILGNRLFIGKANAKTLWKRLNMLSLCKEDVERIMAMSEDDEQKE